jgi:hypothetical protein
VVRRVGDRHEQGDDVDRCAEEHLLILGGVKDRPETRTHDAQGERQSAA